MTVDLYIILAIACSSCLMLFTYVAVSLCCLRTPVLPLQETVTVDLYIIRKIGLLLKKFPQVGRVGVLGALGAGHYLAEPVRVARACQGWLILLELLQLHCFHNRHVCPLRSQPVTTAWMRPWSDCAS